MRLHFERFKSEGVFIGQVLEYPEISCIGKSELELEQKLLECCKEYFKLFPEREKKRQRFIKGIQFPITKSQNGGQDE